MKYKVIVRCTDKAAPSLLEKPFDVVVDIARREDAQQAAFELVSRVVGATLFGKYAWKVLQVRCVGAGVVDSRAR